MLQKTEFFPPAHEKLAIFEAANKKVQLTLMLLTLNQNLLVLSRDDSLIYGLKGPDRTSQVEHS